MRKEISVVQALFLISIFTLTFGIHQKSSPGLRTEVNEVSEDLLRIGDNGAWVDGADVSQALNPLLLPPFPFPLDKKLYKQFEDTPRRFRKNGDRWDFRLAQEWEEFACIDSDSAELVMGLNQKNSHSYQKLINLVSLHDGNLVDTISFGDKRVIVVDVPFTEICNLMSEVEEENLARYTEPNLMVKADLVPNDPSWSIQWGPKMIEADWAWNTTTGNSSILVAIPDCGIDYTHPDLAANYVPLGYDWVNNDTDPIDDAGHGTHCAGIIAAVLNNNVGIAGVAQVRIMAEKMLNRTGWGTEADAAKAIIHAVDQGAKIISCSWGGDEDSILEYEAIQYACENDVLVIASAGNQAMDIRVWPHYPASYDEVVSVAATNYTDERASFSNRGKIEVAAPGVDVYSTFLDGYKSASGTSMACPHVAGVAALIWSRFPNYTQSEVRIQLMRTADDLGKPGFDIDYGYGRVNARRAVEESLPDHDLLIFELRTPRALQPGTPCNLSTIVSNFGRNSEVNVTLQIFVNSSLFNSTTIDFIENLGGFVTVDVTWASWIEGTYEITSYVVPVVNETITENNEATSYIWVRTPRIFRVPEDYPTIEEAVGLTESGWGDKIVVAPGTYYEYLNITKSDLTIVGEDAETTIIDANYTTSACCPVPPPWTCPTFLVPVIEVENANNVSISSLTLRHGGHGMFLDCSSGCMLRDIIFTENLHNFGVYGDDLSHYIHDIDTSNTVNGKPVYYWINEHDRTVPLDAGYIAVIGCTDIGIKDLQLTNNRHGTLVAYSHDITIEKVTALENLYGIELHCSYNVSINNNVIKNSTSGAIIFFHSDGNKITNNIIENNCHYKLVNSGVKLLESNYNTVLNNTITILHNFSMSFSSDGLGIWLYMSNNNVLEENKVTGTGGKKVPPDWLLDVYEYGIYLWSSGSNTVTNNTLRNLSATGIILWNALTCNNLISNNTITYTCGDAFGNGLALIAAQNNTLRRNTLKDINTGISLGYLCQDNLVYHNHFSNNSRAVSIGKDASKNKFYGNNFVDNEQQIKTSNSSIWDNGYPSGGNYWSDYNGTDLFHGPCQNETGSDGIGDAPYVFDENDVDRYPLMNPWRPTDVAIIDVTPSESIGKEGFTLSINVTVENQGVTIEALNVTVYGDKNITVIGDEINIGKQTVYFLTPGTSITLSFTWNTTGVSKGDYTITSRASDMLDEADVADNTKTAGSIVTVLSHGHDIAIKSIETSNTVRGQGYSLSIHVNTKNFGSFPETFNLTVYANTTIIGTFGNITLASGNSTTLTFSWNTTGVAKGSYIIIAKVTQVPGETDITDNTLTSGIIKVTIPGDVDGDFDVDIYDIVKICAAYDSQPPGPPYEPNLDINGDGKIDIYDVVIACSHYDEKDP